MPLALVSSPPPPPPPPFSSLPLVFHAMACSVTGVLFMATMCCALLVYCLFICCTVSKCPSSEMPRHTAMAALALVARCGVFLVSLERWAHMFVFYCWLLFGPKRRAVQVRLQTHNCCIGSVFVFLFHTHVRPCCRLLGDAV